MTASSSRHYRLYIDESGDHSYGKLNDPAFRYLGLLGVWFKRPEPYRTFAAGLERLKLDHFGPSPTGAPVVLHRKDIMQRRGPFGVLNEPARRAAFDSALLELVAGTEFTMVCVVIDKKNHLSAYGSPRHPYHYCMEAMLERYCGWLDRVGDRGDVGAETRGRREDDSLREAYASVYQNGTKYHRPWQLQRTLLSSDLTICIKADNVAGIQLADLLAKPAKDYCLAQRGVCDPAPESFGTRLVEACRHRFNCKAGDGRLDGYGYVLLSSKQRGNSDPL